MSASPPKAGIRRHEHDVRFVPKRTHALQQFFIVIRSPGRNQRKRYARAECLSGFQMERWKNFYRQELQV